MGSHLRRVAHHRLKSTLRTRKKRADLTIQRQVPTIQSAQRTVEVPEVQYIDQVADITVDVQRQVSHDSGFTARHAAH